MQVQDRGDAFVAGLRSDQTNRGRPWERLEKDSQRKPRSGDGDRRHTFSLRAAHGYLGSIKNGPEPQRQDDDVLNVAVIDDRTAYGQGVAEVFKKTAMARGIQVVDEQFTNDKATDFMAILTATVKRLKARGAK